MKSEYLEGQNKLLIKQKKIKEQREINSVKRTGRRERLQRFSLGIKHLLQLRNNSRLLPPFFSFNFLFVF